MSESSSDLSDANLEKAGRDPTNEIPNDPTNEIVKELSFVPTTAPTWALMAMSIAVLTTGTANSIVTKWMNKHFLAPCGDVNDPLCEPRYFEAPNLQTELMWIGEIFCILIWLFDVWMSKRRGTNPVTDLPNSAESYAKVHCPFYFWLIPAVIDYIASTCINYAMVIGQVSTVQMMRNFSVAITAFVSLAYIRVALRRQHWIGVMLIVLGLILTGVYAIFNPDEDTNVDPSMAFLGIILSLVGTSMTGFQMVFQESLFRKYFANPFEGVGWMGLFGGSIGAVVLIVGEVTGFEDVSGSFYQIGSSGTLLFAVILYILCVMLFNACGVSVAKLGSAVMLSILFASRTVSVYLLELALQWASFMALNFCGLVVVTLGALAYYGILLPPSCAPSFADWMATPVMCTGPCRHAICGISLRNPDGDAEAPTGDSFAKPEPDSSAV